MGALAVLDADWSVITKYGGAFDLTNINELSRSVPATFSHPLSCPAGADQLLTSDINPGVVTRTFNSLSHTLFSFSRQTERGTGQSLAAAVHGVCGADAARPSVLCSRV